MSIKPLLSLIILGILTLGIISLYIYARSSNKKLLNEGQRQSVRIINKYTSGPSGRLQKYHLSLSFFTKGDKVKVFPEKDTTEMTNTELKSYEIIQKNLGELAYPKLGEFKTLSIDVYERTYKSYYPGDSAIYVFEKNDFENGKLLSELQDF